MRRPSRPAAWLILLSLLASLALPLPAHAWIRNGSPIGDLLQGSPGPDLMHGRGGNDDLVGWNGDDKLYGDDGYDGLAGLDGNDLLVGGTENDIMWGANGNDRLFGGPGRDILYGGPGSDVLTSLATDDGGYDRVDCMTGFDVAYIRGGDTATDCEAIVVVSTVNVVKRDVLDGNRRGNALLGWGGNDILRGWGGPDRLLGHAGADFLYGGAGPDILFGGSGRDRLYGGDGNDLLFSTADDGVADIVDCGAGRDTARVRDGDLTRGCERVVAATVTDRNER